MKFWNEPGGNFTFPSFFKWCQFSLAQSKIPWVYQGIEVNNFSLNFPTIWHPCLKLSCWKRNTISFGNSLLMTIKQKTWVIFQSPSLAVCKLNIFVFEMFRIHFGTRCYSQDFIDLCLFLNSISVLKETERQQSHQEIETRRNYFTDHLLLENRTYSCD